MQNPTIQRLRGVNGEERSHTRLRSSAVMGCGPGSGAGRRVASKSYYEIDDNATAKCRIRIQMNGSTVFERENPFASDRWSTQRFPVKGAMLRDGVPNTLLIENLEASDKMTGAPWFMLSYAVLRPTK